MKYPEISTIMTVHNGQLFLGQAIESILNQTFRDFELIVINDNSTDDTQLIVEDFCDQDTQIILINNPKNYGPFISANLGLKIAKGAFIARMDADDISLPTRFEKQVSFLESHAEVGLLGTNGSYIDETGKVLGPFRHFENDLEIRWGNLFNSQFIHSSIMFRRSLLPLAGTYREDHKYAQDYEFTSRLLQQTNGANLKEKLVMWRRTGSNISSQKKEEQLKFGTQIAMDNINRLFGADFVVDHEEMLVFRGLYRGTYKNANAEQVIRFLQILEKFIEARKIRPGAERRFVKGVSARMFESIYRKGLNKGNQKVLGKIIRMSPVAGLIGIKNLGLRAVNKGLNSINIDPDIR